MRSSILITIMAGASLTACASTPDEMPPSGAVWFQEAREAARQSDLAVPLLSSVPAAPTDVPSASDIRARADMVMAERARATAATQNLGDLSLSAEEFVARAEAHIQAALTQFDGIDGQTRTTLSE